jgi:hypothetical protein
VKAILSFLLGCIVTGAVVGVYASDLRNELRNARSQAQSELRQVAQDRDTCQERFSRTTFLYSRPTNILGRPIGTPVKVWVIPADVEPEYVGSSEGFFSHYDTKTQVETVKFEAKK